MHRGFEKAVQQVVSHHAEVCFYRKWVATAWRGGEASEARYLPYTVTDLSSTCELEHIRPRTNDQSQHDAGARTFVWSPLEVSAICAA